MVNGGESFVRVVRSGGGSGIVYGLPVVLRHVTQRRMIFLMYCLQRVSNIFGGGE